MNKTYLDDYKFEYVNDGYRSLMHGTNIQDFLIRKFNFFKAGLSLRITYRPFYGALVKTIYPFRKILSGCDARLDALLELERIRRNYA